MPVDFKQWRPHPWHGLPTGPDPPGTVNAYIEITPSDLVKYEADKRTGYLRVDRPQRTSSVPPTLYGFIPRTYCGPRVAALSEAAERADEDPLDICVVTERPIGRADMVVTACVAGVLRGIDHGRADDKIIGVLESDPLWGEIRDVRDLPLVLRERLRHYFRTYKLIPGRKNAMVVTGEAGRGMACQIIRAAMADYEELIKPGEQKQRSQSPPAERMNRQKRTMERRQNRLKETGEELRRLVKTTEQRGEVLHKEIHKIEDKVKQGEHALEGSKPRLRKR